MRRWSAAAVILLGLTGPAAAASLDGIWGVVRGAAPDTPPDCTVLVMILRGGADAGTYTKAMLDIGTTKGPRDSIAGTSTYTVTGDRVEVAPSFSLARPEPRQVFLRDRVGDALIREQPAPRLTFRRCPDRPLRPMER